MKNGTDSQSQRHELGRLGETIAKRYIHGRKTRHTAPFDVVDFSAGVAYEVKTMSALSKDKKIHISDASMARKLEFAEMYGLEMVLLAVVVYSKRKVIVYQSQLRQCIRVSQMTEVDRG